MEHVGSGLAGSGSGPEVTKPKPTYDETQQWMLNSVIFFRQMGFFARHQDATDAEVLEASKSLQEEMWEEPFDDLL